jgi:EmrB/QacA subfamily drug resistance transporter
LPSSRPAVLIATFMAQFDLFVVNVALPVLQRDLNASDAALQLIVGGYAFVYAAGLITAGRLGDRIGHRTVFLLGMGAFGLTSLWCGLAQNPTELVIARLVQGLAGAAMVPQVLALISLLFGPHERARALSAFGVVIGVGSVAGQVLGGVIINADLFSLGWRPIFLVNVPVALIGVAAGAALLPGHEASARPRLDIVGAVGIPVGLGLVLVPLTLGRDLGWPWWTWVSFAAAIAALGVVMRWERRLAAAGASPILDPGLFREPAFTWGLGLSVAIFASFFSFVFTLALLLQDSIGLTPLGAGLSFAPLGIAFAVASILARGFVARFGARVILAGTGLTAVGLLAIVILLASSATPSEASLIGPMVIVGIGSGTAVPVLVGVVIQSVREGAGMVSGVLTTAQQFASAVGVAAVGAVFFTVLGSGHPLPDYARAMLWSASFSLLLAIAAVVISVRLTRVNRQPPAGANILAAEHTSPGTSS